MPFECSLPLWERTAFGSPGGTPVRLGATSQDDDPLLGFVLSPDGSHWRPTPREFWPVALTLRSLACSRVPVSGLDVGC